MLDPILDQTPDRLRGWFALSLPISRAAAERFGLGDALASEGDRTTRLRTIAGALQHAGVTGLTPGELISAALLHAVLRYLLGWHAAQRPGLFEAGLRAATDEAGEAGLRAAVEGFARLYPPGDQKTDDGRAAAELWLLQLAAQNPALAPMQALFADAALQAEAPVEAVCAAFERGLAEPSGNASATESVPDLLRKPIAANPTDLAGQLSFVVETWKAVLPDAVHVAVQRARGVLAEERTPRLPGPGPIAPPVFAPDPFAGPEVEAFTPDRDWMSNVVLIAKLTHVWLDQLSRETGKTITRLDEIPDAVLDRLAAWGFTGLWLIGLWQRSKASKVIKQKMGNPEALSSAYALYDYAIAEDLGGDAAFENLRQRAAARGIRLAADMVPNHVGIDGRWVIEHPERFLRLEQPPYPNYRFTGPDLSEDARVGIYLEDGYWDRSDAAVVFQRVDRETGDAMYIYHGNDGTQMPWNDTAQIDYLDPAAREAVIATIVGVAKRFPIIRFDAAMTLATRHIRRLWHPLPDEAGAIPSRAERAVSAEAFAEALPVEFWREVVDRIQDEVPDTLLLAEAFWMMEGYFVRTLGMHRVYNSAFMNMLKQEDNARYRQTIANTLAFSPEVLKRFVNFVNNPDEETAVAQFGRGDKYLGVAIMMVTLPGLPMFGHGQVEGFTEKYGMEYQRAYRDESPDEGLVARHERSVFPLMRRRHLFSDAEHFALFDYVTADGIVDENVFAYSNRCDEERAVVLYNNAYASTAGWVLMSVPYNVGVDGETELDTRTLAEALALRTDDTLYAFRDHVSDRWALQWGADIAERGLFAELRGYQTTVLLDFRELVNPDAAWRALAEELDGASVPDLEQARRRQVVRAAIEAWDALLTAALADPLDADALDAAEAAFAEAAAPFDLSIEEPAAALGVAAAAQAEAPPVHRAVALLRALTPQGRLDMAEMLLTRLGAAQATLAEALAEALPLDVASEVAPTDFTARVNGPAARAFLGVHAHEGETWFNDERMKALLAAHLTEAALAGAEAEALAEIEAAIKAHVEAARWRFDAL